MSIQIDHVSKRFGAFTALDDVSLTVPSGELVALLGPSGCGKTTLLRIIAGLEAADAGSLRFDGADATRRPVRERRVGFVFQHYALFRHMTVAENVAFGLTVRPRRTRPPKREIRERVMNLLGLVQLDWTADRYPSQLSGGQRQRVALARALAVEPEVLLLDEPFGALDAQVRRDLRRWLRRLHDELHVTSVFVTHDQEEALEVADRVAVMNAGRVEQVGAPTEVYDRPASPFVVHFLGEVNPMRSVVHHGQADVAGVRFALPDHAETETAAAVAFVRPHDLDLSAEAPAQPSLAVILRGVSAVGPLVRVELERHDTGERLEASVTRERAGTLPLVLGHTLYATPRVARVFVGAA
ncbi:sulfate/molybdate ABC transporter ATP-binding protein [Rubrivirga marina]|uniref:Sulfate ABC transporter ATP-binding protein n=1 Tax=Rubrivirga marina TaxID=1196024 RepID=A0A271J0H3_9BACT|nr:TOBE-like domain-containing protein [Rubrivirga marina]PAP77011.1 sulfate ABC transporter ATP-binding protein [Rubrivirga marina]